jgi:hypothetical protein
LAKNAEHVEQRVPEPEALRCLLGDTVTSAKAMELCQEQGNQQDEQDNREPQPPAERCQICVPLQLEAVRLADKYVEPAYAPAVT